MSDFTVRSDSVNVEQIMEQIRARIREKRGVDYTEQQIRELANVKLEKFLDPRAVRSDLLQQFQRKQASESVTSNITFGPNAIFEARRPMVAKIRRLLHPVLRLFFNPDPISQALVRLNDIDPRADMSYELFHNLVIELTRTSIEVKNLKMRVESLTGRLEFNERRARALESAVVYKPTADEAVGAGRPSQGSRSSQESQGSRSFQSSRGSQDSRSAQQGSRGSQGSRSSFSPQSSPSQGAVSPQPVSPAAQAVGLSSGGSELPVDSPAGTAPSGLAPSGEGPGQRSRRRRRRRGRRGGGSATALIGAPPGSSGEPNRGASGGGEETETDILASAGPGESSTAFDAHSTSDAPSDTASPDSPSEPFRDSDPSGEQ